MTTPLVQFVEALPERIRGSGAAGRWQRTVAELKTQPGRWAEVYRNPPHLTQSSRESSPSRIAGLLRRRGAEAKVINGVVFARWPGGAP